MSAKHGADLHWLTILDGREFFTLELQQALLEPPGRSRLLLAPIVDVMKRKDAYFITAHDLMSDVYFLLRCDEKQAQYVVRTSTNMGRVLLDEYAIVIRPEGALKPVAQLAGDQESVYVIPADIVVVRGVCLDILSLEHSRLDVKDLLSQDSDEKR